MTPTTRKKPQAKKAQARRWHLQMLALAIALGGCVTFFGFVAEALVQEFGKPLGLGLFVALFTFALIIAGHKDNFPPSA